ncbi:MAG: hypothetical protein FH751_03830 [Firmicutes bacterium]|nr:hypothetical protein [Bacillota bacterium]
MKIKLSILLIAVMIIGLIGGIGTYAWFSDRAVSSNNTFHAGTLTIDGDNTTEPSPLFKTSYGDGYYSNYDVGLWYPGKEILGTNCRNYTIENTGTLNAQISGLSAEITVFKKDSTDYLIENIDSWPEDVKQSYDEFVQNLSIVVTNIGSKYYEGTLKSLITDIQPLERSDGYVIMLNTTDMKRVNLNFGAVMSTEANNKIQGVSATVNIIIHASQEK